MSTTAAPTPPRALRLELHQGDDGWWTAAVTYSGAGTARWKITGCEADGDSRLDAVRAVLVLHDHLQAARERA